jgi:hypothetical protein
MNVFNRFSFIKLGYTSVVGTQIPTMALLQSTDLETQTTAEKACI